MNRFGLGRLSVFNSGMGLSLFYAGRATDEAEAAAFVAGLIEAASSHGLIFGDPAVAELVIRISEQAEALVVEFDEQLLTGGSVKLSEQDPSSDIRLITSLFDPCYEMLSAFYLVDDDDTVLISRGDVEALNAALDDDMFPEEVIDLTSPTGRNKFDTQWFSHARVLRSYRGMRLEIAAAARELLTTDQWEEVRSRIITINGVMEATPVEGVIAFDLAIDHEPEVEDYKRIAIAASFMIDDILEDAEDIDQSVRIYKH